MSTLGVVLAGGVGERFWPLSRASRPKQLLDLTGSGETLLSLALGRLSPCCDKVVVITGRPMADAVRASVPPHIDVCVEPTSRNTLPAALWGTFIAQELGYEDVVICPADHHINGDIAKTLGQAQELARQGVLALVGIRPDHPSTAFGYIECGRSIGTGFQVERFREKPQVEQAQELMSRGALWNAGWFVWSVDVFLDVVRELYPDIAHHLAHWSEDAWGDLPSTSVDFGVLERTSRVAVVPAAWEWQDLGALTAVRTEVDALIEVESADSIVYAPGRTVALLGVDNLVIVDTGDVLMICPRSRVQHVRSLKQATTRVKPDLD